MSVVAVLQEADRELRRQLGELDQVDTLLLLRFASVRDRGQDVLVTASVYPDDADSVPADDRKQLARALRAAADVLDPPAVT